MKLPAGKTTLLAVLMVLTLSGCHKKQKATLPPQSQAPTVESGGSATTAQPEPAPPEAVTTTTPSTTTPSESAPSTEATTKPKPKPRKPRNHNKPAVSAGTNGTAAPGTAPKPAPSQTANNTATPATPPNGGTTQTSKVVVPQGGEAAATGQISAAGEDDNTRARQAIEQLLQSTDSNLRNITRQLNDNERAMVEQIRTWITQARTASTDGDLTRANNLALKAHLLSDELVKR